MRATEALVDEPVFDHACRHAEQHQQVLLHQDGTAGDVEHGDDLAGRVEHRHRRTGELRELREEVVFAAHRHRRGGNQAGAHTVGAGFGFAPPATGAQAQRRDLGRELGRRDHVHDHAVGIGQHHGGFAVGQLLVQRGHLVARAVDDIGMALAPFLELDTREHARFARLVRAEPVFVEAAAPGAHDQFIDLLVKAASYCIHHLAGVPISLQCNISQRQRHRSLLFGPAVEHRSGHFYCWFARSACAPGQPRATTASRPERPRYWPIFCDIGRWP